MVNAMSNRQIVGMVAGIAIIACIGIGVHGLSKVMGEWLGFESDTTREVWPKDIQEESGKIEDWFVHGAVKESFVSWRDGYEYLWVVSLSPNARLDDIVEARRNHLAQKSYETDPTRMPSTFIPLKSHSEIETLLASCKLDERTLARIREYAPKLFTSGQVVAYAYRMKGEQRTHWTIDLLDVENRMLIILHTKRQQ